MLVVWKPEASHHIGCPVEVPPPQYKGTDKPKKKTCHCYNTKYNHDYSKNSWEFT